MKAETTPMPDPVPASKFESELRDLTVRADEWIEAHADQFDPMNWGDIEQRSVRRKAFGESALYLHVAEREGEPRAERLKQLLIERSNDFEYQQLLARNPQEVHKFGYPLVYASTHGELSDEAREMLHRTLDRQTVWATELPPFRKLDLQHLARMYGYDVPYDTPDFDALVDQSCASYRLNPVEMTRREVYALTHNFLFYHNFGNPGDGFPGDAVSYDHPETLHGLLLRFIAADDCDLVGELLYSAALQRQLPPGLARFALGWLLEQVADEGYVPSPADGLPISAVAESDGLTDLDMGTWDDESAKWGRHYHPTLVAASMGRILGEAWPEIDREENRRDLNYDEEAENLYELGAVFDSLADYDLRESADRLRDLADTPTAAAYPDVFEFAVEFLEAQQRPDGEFGFWTDEKRVYLSMDEDHDEESFAEQLLSPTTETCRETIDAIRDR
ncbi:DUF6895 family protein [Halorussus sp. MSC15.2]|uniref:DUF6895 family protein n=1 Tax=Halorussus sp. MSC15.2 TaxID=2283638 RepID=UPI0013D664FC|nr:hypothetical protein [Halorussus sp. MSC15.2]NEU56670.1 hypothetical protein [Halorussus sp. MSC15.2]